MCGFSRIRLLQPDLHVVAQVGATLPAGAPAACAHPENTFEQIGECGAKIGTKPGWTARPAMLERGVAKPIIGGALVRILQNFVSLIDLLETRLAVLIAWIAIGMPFHRQLAEGRFEPAFVGAALDS